MNDEPTTYSKRILAGLQSKHVYAGTVSEKEIAKRRRKNRLQKISRRKNR